MIADLNEQGEPIDLVTVTSALSDRKLLDEVGGVSYLTELAESVPTAANVDYYSQIVEEKSILRRLIRTATEIAASGYNGGDEVAHVIDSAEKKILEISQRRIGKGFIPIREILMETFERIESLHYNKGKLTGIPAGYTDLDRMTSGFQKSDSDHPGGPPQHGKDRFQSECGAKRGCPGRCTRGYFQSGDVRAPVGATDVGGRGKHRCPSVSDRGAGGGRLGKADYGDQLLVGSSHLYR